MVVSFATTCSMRRPGRSSTAIAGSWYGTFLPSRDWPLIVGWLESGDLLLDQMIERITLDDLGRTKRGEVDKDNTTLIGGAGDPARDADNRLVAIIHALGQAQSVRQHRLRPDEPGLREGQAEIQRGVGPEAQVRAELAKHAAAGLDRAHLALQQLGVPEEHRAVGREPELRARLLEDRGVLRAVEPGGELARAVGRAVVDDDHLVLVSPDPLLESGRQRVERPREFALVLVTDHHDREEVS